MAGFIQIAMIAGLGAVVFDVAGRTARLGVATYRLSGSAMRLLYLLAASPGQVFTPRSLPRSDWYQGLKLGPISTSLSGPVW